MSDVRVPHGWREAVAPPGMEGWEASAVLAAERDRPVPAGTLRAAVSVALAVIAPHVVTGSVEGARAGYRLARTELRESVPPHAVDEVLGAYRDEGRRLALVARGAELVERALRGEPV